MKDAFSPTICGAPRGDACESLVLSPDLLVGRGRERLVYRHPHDPGLLIKTMNPERLARHAGSRRWRAEPIFGSFRREVAAYLRGFGEAGRHPPHLQRIVGFVPTSEGLGMVVDAVRDASGALGRTLEDLAAEARDPAMAAALDRFCDWASGTQVVIHDLSPRNLVYGAGEFVLVDGFGTKTLIPVREYSGWLNRRGGARRARALKAWFAAAAA